MNLPNFSIIIPKYNYAETIENTLNSIVKQYYENKEFIIIDGESNDLTLEIIKRYADKQAFLRWISERDKGIYDAMNKSINIATGK